MNETILAVLVSDLEYFNGETMVTIPEDTTVLVDRTIGVALFNDIHVEIYQHEYSLAC